MLRAPHIPQEAVPMQSKNFRKMLFGVALLAFVPLAAPAPSPAQEPAAKPAAAVPGVK